MDRDIYTQTREWLEEVERDTRHKCEAATTDASGAYWGSRLSHVQLALESLRRMRMAELVMRQAAHDPPSTNRGHENE